MNWRKIRLHFSNSILYISKSKTRESVEYTSTRGKEESLGMPPNDDNNNNTIASEEENDEARRHRA